MMSTKSPIRSDTRPKTRLFWMPALPNVSREKRQSLEVFLAAGLRSGHIEGSQNVFFKNLLNADMSMKSPEELSEYFKTQGIDLGKNREIVTTCGSGMTASVIYLALAAIGKTDNVHLYDGSWAEYGSKQIRTDEES